MPAVNISEEFFLTQAPDRLIMQLNEMNVTDARRAANQAVSLCRKRMPKMSGASSSRISPVYGLGYFGIAWQDSYVWFQEQGIRSFTMTSLQGKTIPMWIDDPTGQERARNPKAKTRTSLSGKTQVLIFRKVANKGDMTTKKTRIKGSKPPEFRVVSTAKHWPGSPGRINRRQAAAPNTTPGKTGGQIATGNIGVWWRHPGLQPRYFLNSSITTAAMQAGFLPQRIYVADKDTWRLRSPAYIARFGAMTS